MAQVAVSMLSADFLHLAEDVGFVNNYSDLIHLDVMDGVFVPNISYGFPVVEAIASVARKPMDVHLMIVNPEKYVERFAKVGASMLSFHIDATEDPAAVLGLIHKCGMKAGVAVNPDIEIERLFPLLPDCDFVLIMSVFAGFGGQKFMEGTYARIEAVRREIQALGKDCKIEVDGGVSDKNAAALKAAGAEILVAGTYVFKAEDPAVAVAALG